MCAPMAELDDLEVLADAVVAACADAYPDVRLARDTARARIAAAGIAAVRASTHHADLGLVWACLAKAPAAQRVVDRAIRGEAERAVRELRRPTWLADEVHQELAQRVLVPADGAAPRLAQYAGQAALGRWLGVAAARTALNLVRRDRRLAPLEENNHDDDALAAAVGGDPAALPPELALVRDRYAREVEGAIRAAFAALDNPRDRNLLRLYYLERVGLDRLGQMFGVHGSTVSRWLAALRETIVDDTRHRLAEQLGMIGKFEDVDSLIRAVRSELDLTLSRILRPGG
jgi:RNA polymerase sigma-70 factor, ECF subfamily